MSNSFIFASKLNNLWESWKLHFILSSKGNNDFIKNELENQLNKENKIRKYLFEIIEKVIFIQFIFLIFYIHFKIIQIY